MKTNFHKAIFFAAAVMLANTVNVNAQSTTSGAAGNNYLSTSFLGWGTTSGDLQFKVNNATKMLIQNNTGNVGIGTGTTALTQKLAVLGSIGWGNTSVTNWLSLDQGGSIELGGTNSAMNPSTNGSPYLDFHFGTGTVQDFNMRIINNANNRLDFAQSGNTPVMSLINTNVGIGTTIPEDKLQVNAGSYKATIGYSGGAPYFGTSYIGFNASRTTGGWLVNTDGSHNGGELIFGDINGNLRFVALPNYAPSNANRPLFTDAQMTSNTKMLIAPDGKILIGDAALTNFQGTPGSYLLYVQKGILTEKVKVAVATTADWSDYVFENGYKLKSVSELEAFVKENKHLPNVPSAEEVVKEGVDMAKMDAKLLEKIEELTLYVIQQQKEIELLKSKK